MCGEGGLYLTLLCHHQNNFCIKMDSDETVSINTTLKRKESPQTSQVPPSVCRVSPECSAGDGDVGLNDLGCQADIIIMDKAAERKAAPTTSTVISTYGRSGIRSRKQRVHRTFSCASKTSVPS